MIRLGMHTVIAAATCLAMTMMAGSVLGQAASAGAAQLDCNRGPVQKQFGGSPWLAYACSDGRSVVLVSAPGNPATPFYFMFSATASGHRLVGEGTGAKAVTDKAYGELKELSSQQIMQIFEDAARSPLPR